MVPRRRRDESGGMTTTASDTPPPQGPPQGQPQGDPTSPPPAYGQAGPRVTRDDLQDVRRLRRTVGPRRTVAGVAGGLARFFDVDPLLIKVAFVVLSFFGGAGLFLYCALWLVVPDERTDRAAINLDERNLKIALIGTAAVSALFLLGAWSGEWTPWPLAIVALVIAFFLSRRDRTDEPIPPPPPGSPYAASYPPYAAASAAAPGVATPASPTYGAAVPSDPSYAAGPPSPPTPAPPAWTPPPPPAPDPRKRGPILFWFTLALLVFATGVLGVVDVAGADVSAAAYPALALGLIGAMLVIGAFWGRAGGIILLGLLTIPPLCVAAAIDNVQTERLTPSPTSAAEVADEYTMDNGALTLDLTQVIDPARLDGRTVRVAGGLGQIVVRVPRGLGVNYRADVNGFGVVTVNGAEQGGPDVTSTGTIPGRLGALRLEISLDVGEIRIETGRPTVIDRIVTEGAQR